MEKNITPRNRPTLQQQLIGGGVSLGYVALAILGTIGEMVWAWNLTVFLTWVLTIMTFLSFAVIADNNTVREKWRGRGPAIPVKVLVILNIGTSLLMAAFGHWFYALMWLGHMVLLLGCEHLAQHPKNERSG